MGIEIIPKTLYEQNQTIVMKFLKKKSIFVDFWEFCWKCRFFTIFSIFLPSFMGEKLLGNRQTQKKFQQWIQKFTKIILETSSVCISSKLVDIFGLKALCTNAWKKKKKQKFEMEL